MPFAIRRMTFLWGTSSAARSWRKLAAVAVSWAALTPGMCSVLAIWAAVWPRAPSSAICRATATEYGERTALPLEPPSLLSRSAPNRPSASSATARVSCAIGAYVLGGCAGGDSRADAHPARATSTTNAPSRRLMPRQRRRAARALSGSRSAGRGEDEHGPGAAVDFAQERDRRTVRRQCSVGARDPGGFEGLAERQRPRLVVGDFTDGHRGPHRLGQRQRHRIVQTRQLVERAGRAQRERADPRPAQRGQVPADAEGSAEVAGQRAHVGARRALDLGFDVEQLGGGPVEAVDVEARDCHRACRELDGRSGTRALVGPFTADLDRRYRRRHLRDAAGQGLDRRAYIAFGDPRGRGSAGDRALGVVGQRRLAEPDRRRIRLVGKDEVTQ